MNDLQKFSYSGKEVRVVTKDGEPWFVGKDVAEVLGYTDTYGAIKKHVDEEDMQNCQNDSFRTPRGMTIVNESGVYSLVFASKLPTARAFKRWVTSDVLPTIRKHGAYMTPDVLRKTLDDPDYIIGLAKALKEEREKRLALEAEKVVLLPKAEYCDAVLRSPSLIPTNVIAKDYGMSAMRFNRMLEHMGVQYKRGNIWEMKAEYQDKGYTQSETFQREGSETTYCWNKWTEKGRQFLYDLLKSHEILPMSEREKKNWHTI